MEDGVDICVCVCVCVYAYLHVCMYMCASVRVIVCVLPGCAWMCVDVRGCVWLCARVCESIGVRPIPPPCLGCGSKVFGMHLRIHWMPLRGLLHGSWGPLGSLLEASWGLFGAPHMTSECSWGHLEVEGSGNPFAFPLLGSSWGRGGSLLSSSWGPFGPSRGFLKPS